MEIRAYADKDWPEVWPIIGEVVAAGTTYAMDPELSEADARRWWVEGPPGLTVVAVVDGRVVGTAKAGPNRPGRGAHIGTASFMVAAKARGLGVGRALGRWIVDWCRVQGFRAIQFNAVVETNVAAVRLWQELGFEIIGTVPEAFDHPQHGLVGLHVMYLRLVPLSGLPRHPDRIRLT